MSGHTPGPWAWSKDYRGLFGSGELNRVLDYASYEGMWLAYTNHQEANARLIAAAPDLLAALKDLLADIEDYQRINRLGGESNHAQVAARAAIAKAEGK